MMNALKFAPVLVAVTIALTVYFARAKRLLVTAVWLALGLGFVMTRLMHAAELPPHGKQGIRMLVECAVSSPALEKEVANYVGC